MRNPFEDKRKNDRINRLAKENEELKAEVELLQVQLSDLTTLNSLYESCIKKLENDLKKEKQISVSYALRLEAVRQALDTTHYKGKEVNNG